MTLARKTPLKAGRPRRCRNPQCCEWFTPYQSLQTWCSPACGVEVAKIKMAKQQRQKDRETRRRMEPLATVCSKAQGAVNAYIRARDQHKGCISCSSPEVTDAGHFFHAGSKYRTSRLRFDHRVIHGQCSQCNRFSGGGNMQGFIEGIRHRYGEQYLADLYELKARADRGELEPLTKDEAREIAAEHRRMARELNREQRGSVA